MVHISQGPLYRCRYAAYRMPLRKNTSTKVATDDCPTSPLKQASSSPLHNFSRLKPTLDEHIYVVGSDYIVIVSISTRVGVRFQPCISIRYVILFFFPKSGQYWYTNPIPTIEKHVTHVTRESSHTIACERVKIILVGSDIMTKRYYPCRHRQSSSSAVPLLSKRY